MARTPPAVAMRSAMRRPLSASAFHSTRSSAESVPTHHDPLNSSYSALMAVVPTLMESRTVAPSRWRSTVIAEPRAANQPSPPAAIAVIAPSSRREATPETLLVPYSATSLLTSNRA